MLRKVVVLVVIGLFFGAGIISNVIGDKLSENKLNSKELVITENFQLNTPPIISNPSPNIGEKVGVNFKELSVMIEDPDNDEFNWSIETSPYIGNTIGKNKGKILAYCFIENLQDGTEYTWFVNASDGISTSSMVYTFETIRDESIPVLAEVLVLVRSNSISVGWSVNQDVFIDDWKGTDHTVKINYKVINNYDVSEKVIVNWRIREYQHRYNTYLNGFLFLNEGGNIQTPGYVGAFKFFPLEITVRPYESYEGSFPINITVIDPTYNTTMGLVMYCHTIFYFISVGIDIIF